MSGTLAKLDAITGVILAGGRATRMGGDKAMRQLAGYPLISRVIDRIEPQLSPGRLFLNADHPLAGIELNLVADTLSGRPGPLAGLLAAMLAGQDGGWVLSVPTDTPFLPRDLVSRLRHGLFNTGASIALAASANGLCQVCGLWPVHLTDDLARFLASGQNKVLTWASRQSICQIEFPPEQIGRYRADPFFNVNTPEDLAEAERMLSDT